MAVRLPLDESVIPNAAGAFIGAVDNFSLSIGGDNFSGQNGRLTQFSSANGLTDFFAVSIGETNGTVSGTTGTDVFTKFSLDWRGSDLFADPGIPMHDRSNGAFDFRRVTLRFNNSTTSVNTVIDNAAFISAGTLTAVPLPAAGWLLASGLLGMLGVTRRRAKTS